MIWKRRRRERELEEEIRGHLRMAERDRVERGAAEEDARLAARREFGNRGLVAETTREVWGWGLLDRVAQDLRYAGRALRRSPGFTAVAIGTLALGIGATTALFSAIEAVLLRPLPYKAPGELIAISHPSPKIEGGEVISPLFAAWRSEERSFAGLAAWNDEQYNVTGAGEPERVTAASVNADFLRTLGVAPYLGRDFELEQDRGNDTRFVLLGYELWQRQFRGDAGCIGRQVKLSDQAYTIVGVLPRGFRFPGDLRPELLVPGGYSDPADWKAEAMGLLRVIGRTRPGVPAAKAADELATIEKRSSRDFRPFQAELLRDGRVVFSPLADRLNGSVRRPLLILWGAVSLVLLLVAANLAGLQLARGSARSGELALRAALGAGRSRLARLVLAESLLVAFAGGALGVLAATWLIGALRGLAALDLPSPEAVRLDGAVLAFALAITLGAGLLAGLAPALMAARTDLAEAMKAGSRSVTQSWRGGLRRALVAGEVALAMILLLGGGLLLRSMARLLSTPLGIDPSHTLTMSFRLPWERYDGRRRAAFVDEMVARARAMPGVEHAAMTNAVPLRGYNLGYMFRLEGAPDLPPGQAPSSGVLSVTPEYFATLRVPLLGGRAFQVGDGAGAPGVAIVNHRFVQRYFEGRDPVGRRLQLGATGEHAPWLTIVGVVGDTRQRGPRREAQPEIFRPNDQEQSTIVTVLARTTIAPEGLAAALRAEARRIDPELPVYDVTTMEDRVAHATASERLQVWLIGAFAMVATVLAALGVYGVIAHTVSQRTHEIGLRLALGAAPGRVLRSVAGSGMRMAAAGVVLGLAGGYLLTRYLKTLLFEVGEHDAVTFAAASAVLLGMALLASWLPARRAARVDPVVALRCE